MIKTVTNMFNSFLFISVTLCLVTVMAYASHSIFNVIPVATSCVTQPLRITVRPPAQYGDRCESISIRTSGCRGQCPSYAKINRWNSSLIMRECR